jgi:hypothetical protein
MSHLPTNTNHWYIASPFTFAITIEGATSASLSNLEWVIDGAVSITTGITVADNADGDAVVSVPVAAADTTNLIEIVYRWQLQASVSGSGPRVVAAGSLRLEPLAAA